MQVTFFYFALNHSNHRSINCLKNQIWLQNLFQNYALGKTLFATKHFVNLLACARKQFQMMLKWYKINDLFSALVVLKFHMKKKTHFCIGFWIKTDPKFCCLYLRYIF